MAPKSKNQLAQSQKNLSPGGGYVHKSVTRKRNLSAQAKGLYANIVTYIGNNEHCWPGKTTLAVDMDTCERTIGRLIDELEQAGVLIVERTTGKVNKYRLNHTVSSAEPVTLPIPAIARPEPVKEAVKVEVERPAATVSMATPAAPNISYSEYCNEYGEESVKRSAHKKAKPLWDSFTDRERFDIYSSLPMYHGAKEDKWRKNTENYLDGFWKDYARGAMPVYGNDLPAVEDVKAYWGMHDDKKAQYSKYAQLVNQYYPGKTLTIERFEWAYAEYRKVERYNEKGQPIAPKMTVELWFSHHCRTIEAYQEALKKAEAKAEAQRIAEVLEHTTNCLQSLNQPVPPQDEILQAMSEFDIKGVADISEDIKHPLWLKIAMGKRNNFLCRLVPETIKAQYDQAFMNREGTQWDESFTIMDYLKQNQQQKKAA